MQEKNNRFQSLYICRRLFDFIFNNLIARGGFNFKSVALDHPLPQSSSNSNKVPDCSTSCVGINNGVLTSSDEEQPMIQAKPNIHELIKKVEDDDHDQHDDSDFAIQVHHKETDDLEYWTPDDNLGSSIYLSDHKDSTIPSIALAIPEKTQLRRKEKEISAVQATSGTVSNNSSGSRARGKDSKEVETAIFTATPTPTPMPMTRTRSSGTKKMMSSIKDLARGEKSSGKKQGKNSIIMTEKLTLAVEAEDMEMKAPVRQVIRPLFNVAMSINEKSDAFIRSRKAAMRGSYDFETNQTS